MPSEGAALAEELSELKGLALALVGLAPAAAAAPVLAAVKVAAIAEVEEAADLAEAVEVAEDAEAAEAAAPAVAADDAADVAAARASVVEAAALLDNAARAPDATLPEIMARREVRSDDELAPSHRNSWLALVVAARECLGRPEVRKLGGAAEVTSRLRRLIAYGECLHEIVLTEELYVTRDLGVLLERVCQPLDRLLVAQRRSCAAQLGVGACFCCHVGAAARDNALLPWTRQVGALSLLHTALVDEWAQRRRNPTGSFSGGGGGVTAACVCAALSKKLPFLERVYREALRHSRGPPPIEARLDELRASNLQVAQILDLVEHAHVLVHGSRSAIAPTIYDSQPVQRLLDAPRRRLFNYPLLLRELERAMPPSHPARANVRELAAKVERVAARVDDPLDAFLGERRGEFLFQDEVRALRSSLSTSAPNGADGADAAAAAAAAPAAVYMRLDEFQAEYEGWRRERGIDEPAYAWGRGHYAATFGARGLRVERGVRHDVEAATEVTAVWLVGVQPRGHANV